ncbi:hypothetical protein [Castellaniella sp. GW247-6E4]|uniref:hypothetical protein n=1 Tax=Castellaniella sp. GW247-6E4 TaxID=3140380 RepID=UPI003314D0CC
MGQPIREFESHRFRQQARQSLGQGAFGPIEEAHTALTALYRADSPMAETLPYIDVLLRISGVRGTLAAGLLLGVGFYAGPAAACDGAQRIRLSAPVELPAAQLAEFRAMPPLRVAAMDAAPMAQYDPTHRIYTGISVDVLCFIAQRLGFCAMR